MQVAPAFCVRVCFANFQQESVEGSQVSKARPGASFDFTHRYCRGYKLCHFTPDSPQRGDGPTIALNYLKRFDLLEGGRVGRGADVGLRFTIAKERLECFAPLRRA